MVGKSASLLRLKSDVCLQVCMHKQMCAEADRDEQTILQILVGHY